MMDDHGHDIRPWGAYHVVDDGPNYKVKRIVVAPGKRLSYQVHSRRSEHWFVIQGAGIATLEGRQIDLQCGVAVDVPVGVAHRIENVGTDDLVFIEVQSATTSARMTSSGWRTISGGSPAPATG